MSGNTKKEFIMNKIDYLEKIKSSLKQECIDIKESVIQCSDYKFEEYHYMRGVNTGIETAIEMINEYLDKTIPAEKELEELEKKNKNKQPLLSYIKLKNA